MNIYLDIDGVLVTNEGLPAPFLHEFLEYATTNHQCFWLTTHCRFGDAQDALRYLKMHIKGEDELLERIKPTTWDVLKTDGIDFSKEFLWLDDYIMEAEIKVLGKNGKLGNFIHIDLDSNPAQLKEIISHLQSKALK